MAENINGNGKKVVPILDPTINVSNLLNAAVNRIDDLREAETKRVDEKISDEKKHVREIMELRADHAKDLTQAEAKRIDAIRVVDVNAVSVANERATAQASVLANQVAASADTLRTLVATTAQTVATQFQAVTTQLTDRLAILEKAVNVGSGREAYTDPIMKEMLLEVKNMKENMSIGTGKGQGLNAGWAYLLGGIGLIGTIGAIILAFVK